MFCSHFNVLEIATNNYSPNGLDCISLMFFFSIALVVLTTLVGYAMAPCPTVPSVLLYSCMGTALCSAAANTFNQVMLHLLYITVCFQIVITTSSEFNHSFFV